MTEPTARIVLDSISPQGHRLTTVAVTAHRFILAEINTHRVLSRSYRSSRAVPVAKLLEEVRTDPAEPVWWGKNQPGMQAPEELSREKDGLDLHLGFDEKTTTELITGWEGRDGFIDSSPLERARSAWHYAARSAANSAESLAKIGLHKQIANRVLEPFLWVNGVLTGTEWDNFYGLRLHKDAQPEFRVLADAVWAAKKASTPEMREPGVNWHIPYFDPEDWEAIADYAEREAMTEELMTGGGLTGSWAKDLAVKVSVARCARSSYRSFDTGRRSTVEEDLATYAKLNIPGTEFYDPKKPIHAGPSEHQATPDVVVPIRMVDGALLDGDWKNPEQHGNLTGWRQYRKMLPGEACAPLPEGYDK